MVNQDLLENLLRKQSKELYVRLCLMEEKTSKDLLPFAQLPDFTDHGIKHARSVQQILSDLIPKRMPEPLTAFEIFCLLSAAILHDVGMLVKKSSGEPLWETRIDHYNRSKEFVVQNHESLGFSEHEAQFIGEICRAHGMPNLNYLDGGEYSIRKLGSIRIRLLCALLRLADALDITSDRAPRTVADNRKMPAKSRHFWDVHHCISDVQIQTDPSWDIRIVVMPKQGVKEENFYLLRNEIQKELDTIYPVLRAFGIYFKKVDLILNRVLSNKPNLYWSKCAHHPQQPQTGHYHKSLH